MIRIYRTPCMLLFMMLALAAPASESHSFEQVVPERIGEFVTVSGKVKEFHYPPEPRAPFAFTLEDEKSSMMRVVAWPDIFERVDGYELLKQPGTSVTLTAEVAEYKEKLELHLQDWEEIAVASSDTVTTSALGNDAATTGSLRWVGGDMTTSVVNMNPLQAATKTTTATVEP